MKYSHKLSDAVHVLAFIDIFQDKGDLSSNGIAGSINSNPSLVRRLMSALVKAGLLVSQPGVAAPSLARSTSEISLLDVYNAVEEDHHLLHVDETTNVDCPVGANIQGALTDAYNQVQAQAEKSMAEITLDQIVDDIQARRLKTANK